MQAFDGYMVIALWYSYSNMQLPVERLERNDKRTAGTW